MDSTVDACANCGGNISVVPSEERGPFWEDATCDSCNYQWTQPRPQDDLISCLEDSFKGKPMSKVAFKLTDEQKAAVAKYVLVATKGIAEDVDVLWDGMTQEEIDGNYTAVTDAVEEFINEIKETTLKNLS